MTSTELVTTTAGTLAGLEVPAWQVAAGAWLMSKESENTRAAYRRDLHAYATHLAELGIGDPLSAGRVAVDTWARRLSEAGLSPATRARKLAAVSSFYAYCAEQGALTVNPAANVKRPRVSAESPRLGMTSAQAVKVIAAAQEATPAHRAIIALCFMAGLRISEALALTPGDLREEAGHRVAAVTGKGGTVSTVVLVAPALRLLADALEAAEADGGPIIRGPRGGTIDRHQALRMVEALGRTAGLEHKLRPHDLRHACATLALEAGAPLHRVQDHLRHASPTTTQRYTRHREKLDNSAAYKLAEMLGGVA